MILAHFNPSTLKVPYQSTDKKQIVTNVSCAECSGDTPYEVDVTFSSVTTCDSQCCNWGAFSSQFVNTVNLGGTYRLKFVGGCTWRYATTGSYGSRKGYNRLNCVDPADRWSEDLDTFIIEITNVGGGVWDLTAWVQGSGATKCYIHNMNYTPTSGCLNKSGLVYDANCCTSSVIYHSDTTAAISEV